MLANGSQVSLHTGLVEYFRTPEYFFDLDLIGKPSACAGYFRFGSDTICYGRTSVGIPAKTSGSELYDALRDVQVEGSRCLIPFDPSEVVDNLRRERYVADNRSKTRNAALRKLVWRAYYLVRPLLQVTVRKRMQQFWLKGWNKESFPSWPIDRTADRVFEQLLLLTLKAHGKERIPFIWFWPDGKSGCLVMTHDVETRSGLQYRSSLMDLDDSYGIKSSFQIIPKGRYTVCREILEEIRDRGFEINVHDWNHDGFLFSEREIFFARAAKINQFAAQYGVEGFRSGALYRNTDWYDAFTFSYDMSVPNVGHLDPQPGGCCTVMPYFIGQILEIPVTTTQDYVMFHILGDYSIDLWKHQIKFILEGNGLASFIVHPDYITEKRAAASYVELLAHLSRLHCEQNVWCALPQEVNRWWRERSRMKLVEKGSGWCLEGPGKDRARIAYAVSDGQRLVYTLD